MSEVYFGANCDIKAWQCYVQRNIPRLTIPPPPPPSQRHGLGSPLAVLTGHSRGVTSVCFSPTVPHVLLTSSDDGTCRIWSVLHDAAGGRPAPSISLAPDRRQPEGASEVAASVRST